MDVGRKTAKLLLHDMDGNGTRDKEQESMAVKEYLAAKGRGRLTTYTDLLNEVRSRRREESVCTLDPDAVVGILDTKCRAAVSPTGKTHGPDGVPTDVYSVAPVEMARLIDLGGCAGLAGNSNSHMFVNNK